MKIIFFIYNSNNKSKFDVSKHRFLYQKTKYKKIEIWPILNQKIKSEVLDVIKLLLSLRHATRMFFLQTNMN